MPSNSHSDGRPVNGGFDFDPKHNLFASHFQQLRSKHKIPILIRLPPKKPPSKSAVLTDKWMKETRHLALYYLTLFRPWTHLHPNGKETHSGILNWHQLSIFMRDLEFGNEENVPTDVQKVIKRWIEQQSQGMRVTAEERTTVRMRRNINATPWGRYDGSQPLRVRTNNTLANNKEAAESAKREPELKLICFDNFYPQMILSRSNPIELMYLQYTLDALENVTPAINLPNSTPLTVEKASKLLNLYQESVNQIDDIIQRLQDEDIDLEDGNNEEEHTIAAPADSTQTDHFPSRKDSNQQQTLVLDILLKTLHHPAPKVRNGEVDLLTSQQTLLLAHGAPGTGKTFMAKTVVKELEALGLDTYCIVSTVNASGNLPRGRTIHNGLGIPCEQKNEQYCPKLLDDHLCKIQKRIRQNTVALLIIDEVSCVTGAMLAHINQRLQQIMGCYEIPFGGLSVLLMGDMFQLPPVKGQPIHQEIVQYALQHKEIPGKTKMKIPDANDPSFSGHMLFQLFKSVELTKQMRAADDMEHSEFLNQMRYPQVNKPRIPADIPNRFKVYKSRLGVISSIQYGPILVTKNTERQNINKFK